VNFLVPQDGGENLDRGKELEFTEQSAKEESKHRRRIPGICRGSPASQS
jgi:hypothetical protein